MTAAVKRAHVVLSGPPVPHPDVETASGRAQWQAASLKALEPELCEECGEDGHFVTARLYPRPDEARDGVRDALIEACTCCTFGPIGKPQRGLLARLRSEQAEGDDFDIRFEVMFPDGTWHDGRRL